MKVSACSHAVLEHESICSRSDMKTQCHVIPTQQFIYKRQDGLENWFIVLISKHWENSKQSPIWGNAAAGSNRDEL